MIELALPKPHVTLEGVNLYTAVQLRQFAQEYQEERCRITTKALLKAVGALQRYAEPRTNRERLEGDVEHSSVMKADIHGKIARAALSEISMML